MAARRQARGKAGANDSRTTSETAGRAGHDLMERGDIFFFYRPAGENAAPGGLLEVNRFHIVLRPEGSETLRYITIGKKKLPDEQDDQRNWGFVDGVFHTAGALRECLLNPDDAGVRSGAGAVPAGEGVYELLRQGRNTVLAYALALPDEPGEVQRTFNIRPHDRLTLVMKNPEAGSPVGVGLNEDRRVEYPEELQARFGGRKWVGADPPEFLDHEGAELVLIAEDDSGADLGIELEVRSDDPASAKLFKELKLERSDRAVRPLFEGSWA